MEISFLYGEFSRTFRVFSGANWSEPGTRVGPWLETPIPLLHESTVRSQGIGRDLSRLPVTRLVWCTTLVPSLSRGFLLCNPFLLSGDDVKSEEKQRIHEVWDSVLVFRRFLGVDTPLEGTSYAGIFVVPSIVT